MQKNDLSQWATLQTFRPESLQINIFKRHSGYQRPATNCCELCSHVAQDYCLNHVSQRDPHDVGRVFALNSSEQMPKATLTKQVFLDQHDASIVNAPAGNTRAIVAHA